MSPETVLVLVVVACGAGVGLGYCWCDARWQAWREREAAALLRRARCRQ